MSLMKLPTELRLMIFQNLDSAAVYRLMLTSKELRREAEPCLYQNISIIRPDRLQYLLVKILNRRELIKHTRSFSLQVADPEGLLRSVEFSPEELASIRSVIEEFNEEWLEFDSKAPIRELSLSLVLCLAINLEELHLVFVGGHIKHYYMLSRFLATDWLMCQSYNDGLPFRKLQTFSLDTRSDKAGYEDLDQMIPRSTSLQNIFLSNLPVNKIISEFFDPHLRMAFHTLALDSVESELYEIHGILKQPCFQHLKRLVIKNLPYKDIRRGRLPRPMRLLKTSGTLSEVIVQNLPELEELEISNVRIRAKERRGLCKDFDLGNHQNLTKLVIDYDLLATDKLPHTEICLLNSEQVLPPRLRSMTLTGVNECSLKILVGLYENYSKDPGRAATFISALFRVDGIREFDLELQLWKEKNSKTRHGHGCSLSPLWRSTLRLRPADDPSSH